MPNLKTVILPIGYPTLFFDLGHTPESWRLTHYYRDFGFQISPRHFRFQYFTLSKMLKYNLEELSVYYNKKGNSTKISELGWGKDYKNSSDRDIEKTAKVSIFWHTAPESESFESNKNYLEQIAKICHDKGVILLLINPPVHITYLERRESEQVKKTIEFLEFVSNSYQNLIYVDFSDDDSFKNEDFYDADHLNGKGTKKLSLKLNQLVKAHGKF
jgi:hypothetical protein